MRLPASPPSESMPRRGIIWPSASMNSPTFALSRSTCEAPSWTSSSCGTSGTRQRRGKGVCDGRAGAGSALVCSKAYRTGVMGCGRAGLGSGLVRLHGRTASSSGTRLIERILSILQSWTTAWPTWGAESGGRDPTGWPEMARDGPRSHGMARDGPRCAGWTEMMTRDSTRLTRGCRCCGRLSDGQVGRVLDDGVAGPERAVVLEEAVGGAEGARARQVADGHQLRRDLDQH